MPQIIGMALFQLGATTLATWVVTSATAAFIINAGIAIGLSLLANALQPHPSISPSDGQTEIKQALSPRIKSFGTVRISGIVCWLDAILDVLYYGLAFNHGRISAIVSYHINENTVTIDGTDKVTTAPYNATNVFLHSRLGVAIETAYSDILTAFGVSNWRGDGIASLLATIQNPATVDAFQTAYPDGRPTIRVTINSSVVWDPRDATQSRTDATTWLFSANPVVCLLNYMIDADGYGMPWSLIEGNLTEWTGAMDICDESVDLANGGTSPRYRLAMTFSLTDNPKDVASRILTACDGRIWARRGGTIGVVVGRFTAPTVTIESRDILAYGEMTRGQDPLFAVAGIRAQYMSPDNDYREHEAEPWPDGATVLALSEDRTVALDLTTVPSHRQARQLMKRVYVRETANWRGTIVTNLAGLRAIDERFINIVIDELGISESFEVGRFTLNPDNTIEMDVRSVGSEIDDWNPATEEGTATDSFDNFAFVSSFSKLGTALDPLAEAGGALGQTIVVFGAASGLAATPAGYTLITSAGPTSGLAIGAWVKALDGTEGSATFLSASGVIVSMTISGAPNPTTSDINQTVTTGNPVDQLKEAINAPYMIFGYGADDQNETTNNWVSLHFAGPDITENAQNQSNGSTLSGLAVMLEYSSSETPVNISVQMVDRGTNGLLSFILRPGT